MRTPRRSSRVPAWMTRGVLGIVVATFFSDVGHEMATATLPLYLTSIGLGAAALGAMEGLADLAFSLSKLAGGWVGHHTERKRPLASLGYVVTALGTAALALTESLAALVSMRAAAWLGRGFRSPLRDFMLADEVDAAFFARAYGLERAMDMVGAVAGPLVAVLLLWAGVAPRTVILAGLLPSLVAAATFFVFTRDRGRTPGEQRESLSAAALPASYWRFTGAVALFGLGDFSRTFLILLAAQAFDPGSGEERALVIPMAVLLYAAHNGVSALAAYPAGLLGDRLSKRWILVAGYALGCGTNVLLAFHARSPVLLSVAIVASGIYIAIEETLEKAVVADALPRPQRSLGLGILAGANALGDMVSSVLVGLLLSTGHERLAFAIPAVASAAGTISMAKLAARAGGGPQVPRP